MTKEIKMIFFDEVKIQDALKLYSKSGEKVKSRNKPVKEVKQYADDTRSQILTKERTEEETKVYHEGKVFKNGKWINHPKHLKSSKKHKLNRPTV